MIASISAPYFENSEEARWLLPDSELAASCAPFGEIVANNLGSSSAETQIPSHPRH